MNQDKIIIVVSAICNKNGKTLLLRRSAKNASYKGAWQLPEGKVEYGESPKDALRRELLEEIGIHIGKLKLIDALSSFAYKLKTKYHIIRLVYKTTCKGEIKLSKDHDDFGWFYDLSRIKIMPGIAQVIKKEFPK